MYKIVLKFITFFTHKTENTLESFWNVYCLATNQMQDETPKDNHQTSALISHNLTQTPDMFSSNLKTYLNWKVDNLFYTFIWIVQGQNLFVFTLIQ